METEETKELFNAGKKLADGGNYKEALKAFDPLYSQGTKVENLQARIKSYYGLCIAMVLKQRRTGLELCKDAAEEEVFYGDVCLNLGKLYISKGSRSKAYSAFVEGFKREGGHDMIRTELKKMGIRKRPPIRFLSRSNPINKWLGIILSSFRK